MKQAQVQALCWAALGAVGKKESRRDELVAGLDEDVSLRVSGEVRGKPFAASIDGHVAVGHDGKRNESAAPPVPHLVGFLLGQLSKKKREAILKELPAAFAEADSTLPDVDAALVEQAENLLGRLRSTVQKHVRGSVSVSWTVHSLT